jgi:hypothetical protein
MISSSEEADALSNMGLAVKYTEFTNDFSWKTTFTLPGMAWGKSHTGVGRSREVCKN